MLGFSGSGVSGLGSGFGFYARSDREVYTLGKTLFSSYLLFLHLYCIFCYNVSKIIAYVHISIY
jgi:hypothetical protein